MDLGPAGRTAVVAVSTGGLCEAVARAPAAEVAADGVTANVLLPGGSATDRGAEPDAAAAGRTGQSVAEVQAASRAMFPAGRYGRPVGFGAVAAFLCGAAAGYVMGTALRCDGGTIRSL